ncbi:MAG: 4Fe-4S dicluster domain-containing protein [Candidatus Aenigmarchaeota archaeon]|nr:4Fe-4S dicluster domain-containing protein [Candidatus Aenigmarchaeota archaeon]
MVKEAFYLIRKSDFPKFIDSLVKKTAFIAPVLKKGEWNYKKIDTARDLNITGFTNTEFPPKKFLIPEGHVIAEYDNGKLKKGKDGSDIILFGMRPCDVHGILVLDKVMLSGEFTDDCYNKKRNSITIFALNCSTAGENCFCDSMETCEVNEGYDLLFTEQGNNYHVQVGSPKGKKFISSALFKKTSSKAKKTRLKFKKKLNTENLPEIMKASFESKIWEDTSKKCLSCASCTSICPTCYCFDILHENSEEKGKGKIVRDSNYCMLKPFTKVAGNVISRKSRTERLKQFFYHKLVYGKENQGKYHCVGCGRCITECMTKIDITEEVKKIRNEYAKRKLRS